MKKRFLFLIIIVCLFAISAVSAEKISNETNMVANDDSSLIVESINEDTLSVSLSEEEIQGNADNGTFTALQERINNALEGSTINLKNNYDYDEGFSKDGININKSLTINGNGYTIDGKNNARIFNINANVSLENINFINGYTYEHGGAIFWQYGGGFILNCQFDNNSAWSYGWSCSGGAIYLNSSVNVTNCNFNNNTAFHSGGAIYIEGSGSVTNCNFTNNSVYYNGGAICIECSINVTNCNFADNTAFNGGAIYTFYPSGHVIIDYCNFTTNMDNSSDGAIFFDSSGSVINCNFINNSGAVCTSYYSDYVNIDYCNFINNYHTISSANALTVSFCNFTGNTADMGGGAISLYAGGNVTNCNFIDNKVSGYGGAIYISSGGNITNCNFTGNTANIGGAIYASYNSTFVKNCNFTSNTADIGGAIYTWHYVDFMNIDYCNLIDNNASEYGGAIYSESDSSIANCYFINNSAFIISDIYCEGFLGISNSTFMPFGIGNNIYYNISNSILNNEGIVFEKSAYNIENCILIVNDTHLIDIFAPNVTKYYKGSEKFVITIKDANEPVVGGEVKIYLNGQSYNRTTDNNGQASMAINLNSGIYNVTSEYNGKNINSTIIVKDTVIAKDFSKIFRNETQYHGTFVNSQGNLIRNTDVEININGVFYTRKIDGNGVAQMNINLPPGTYILTATNPLSNEQHTTKVTVLPSIVENHDLTMYYKNGTRYQVKIIGDNGKPVGAGVKVTFNINGVIYDRTTDANGYAGLNINLVPGTYTITAEYKGLRASNTITVLSVLQTKDLSMKYKDGSKFEAKILDGQGKPYAGQTVTFNINGVFYQKTTGADGIASLNINLMAGDYIITSSYNGLNGANSITIGYDFWHLPDSTDPYPEVGRINYRDGWVGQIYNDNYKRTINLNTLEVYGSYGDFTALGIVMVADDGRYYYYDNGDFAYHGENYDSFDYHTDVQWWYNNLPKSVNPRPPLAQYFDILGPNGANGYVYYPDGTYAHFVNDIVVDSNHYVDKTY